MAKDRFGYGENSIEWDDPWGDNIVVPYRGGQPIRGEEASKYQPGFEGFQEILYKGHTSQIINKNNYSQKDIDQAIEWYRGAADNAMKIKAKYSDRPDVVRAQDEKLQEVEFVLQQIMGDK